MFNTENLIVRVSGKKEGYFYIDYLGHYKVNEIAKAFKLDGYVLNEIYNECKAIFDEELEVFYFASLEDAKEAVGKLIKKVRVDRNGRLIFFTEAELEYIRKAMINEGNNLLRVENKIKDEIFKKLNGLS